jgi:hypothetical protein
MVCVKKSRDDLLVIIEVTLYVQTKLRTIFHFRYKIQSDISIKSANKINWSNLLQGIRSSKNRKMNQIKVSTAIALLDIFWPDFEEVDGSVYLTTNQKKTNDGFFDRTDMETFYNHTHMIDLFKHNAGLRPIDEGDDRFYDEDHPDFLGLCELGKTLAQMWFQKLKLDFPQYDFRVYYTQDDDPIVRFHRVRPGEPNWIEEEQWFEKIEAGKVVIYDTRKKIP